MKVAYYLVQTVQIDPATDETTIDLVGVVAESKEEATLAVTESINGVTVIEVEEVGPVRFIRHTFRGPRTEVHFKQGRERVSDE